MADQRDEILIQRYLLGELEGSEREDFERRLESEEALACLLDSYRSLCDGLHLLEDPEPPADLWARRIRPAIAEQLDIAGERPNAGFSFLEALRLQFLKPAVVVAAFVVVIVGITLLLQYQIVSPVQEDRYEKAISNIQKLRDQFLAELDTLTFEMEKRKPMLSSELRKVYDQTLKDIDESIAKAERFYFAYPNDSDAVQFLFAAYEKKVEFIEQFKQIEPLSPEA
ncbi:MAG TPA: hypothetical protein VMX35_14925 [Acidobacteriota bacterium]|nr:hypothetical protein [Acidobacteriota bacterium]